MTTEEIRDRATKLKTATTGRLKTAKNWVLLGAAGAIRRINHQIGRVEAKLFQLQVKLIWRAYQ